MKSKILRLAGSAGAMTAIAAVVLVLSPDDSQLGPEVLRAVTGTSAQDCPSGAEAGGLGPAMSRLAEGFCIDTTEVTRGQYEAWIDTTPSVDGQSAACAANADYTPSCYWKPGGNKTEQPVVCVDWCDAQAFCVAAGKRLCGKLGEGAGYPFDGGYDDPTVSEWHAACTSGGKHEYTYGSEFDTDRCRDADADDYTTWGFVDVAGHPDCRSPEPEYSAVFDLSGHIAEWEDSCGGDGPDDHCRIRGGSYEHHSHGTRCDMGRSLEWPRSRQVPSVGFRCCAD